MSMPSLDALEYLGQATVPYINMHGVHTFRRYLSATPRYNFVAVFYGQTMIQTGGEYTWCTRSSDGSELYINDALFVNNKGRHSDKKVCGKKRVPRGLVKVEARVFSSSGTPIIHVMYDGPDTQKNSKLMRSKDATKVAPKHRPTKSNWFMRIYKSSKELSSIPEVSTLKLLGEAEEIATISFSNMYGLRKLVPETPSANFMWVIYGSLKIQQKGEYEFCSTSDDGSRIILDNYLVVDNDGLHGALRRCASRVMDKGSYPVEVEGFQRGGGVYQTVTYRGPDTGNARLLMRSVGDGAGEAPAPRPPSSWTLRMYSSHSPLTSVPNLAFCEFVEETQVSFVDFDSWADFKTSIGAKMPSKSNYVYAAYGNVKIGTAGLYTFCTTSSDGSLLYVDGVQAVNNDGLHARGEKCGQVKLEEGLRKLLVEGFKQFGDAYVRATYSGPDTGNVKRFLRSDNANAPAMPGCYGRHGHSLTPTGPSTWTLRIFKASQMVPQLRSMSDAMYQWLDFVGEKVVKDIYIRRCASNTAFCTFQVFLLDLFGLSICLVN